MANITKPLSSITPRIVFWKNLYFTQAIQKSYNIDKIDCFTTNLVREKTIKWHKYNDFAKSEVRKHRHVSLDIVIKGVKNDIENINSLHSIGLEITKLTENQLNSLILAAIKTKNEGDFYYIINQCIQKKVPIVCKDTLTFLSIKGEVEIIDELDDLFSEIYGKKDAIYKLYKGFAYWNKGNIILALNYLKKVSFYPKNESEVNDIRRIFKLITNETFNKKGEAILLCLITFAKELNTERKDRFLLGYIWKLAFTSTWFSDQNLSLSIFHDYKDLREVIAKGSLRFCREFLKNNNTEPVYRLIELFLKYNQKEACENCLNLLFNYHYYHQDIRACREIINFLKTSDIPITTTYNEKLLNLLLGKNIGNDQFSDIISEHKFQFQF